MRKFLSIALLFYVTLFFAQNQAKRIEQLIDNYVNTMHSDPDAALIFIQKATQESKQLNDEFLLSRCLYNQGNFYYLQNDLEQSKKFITQSLYYAQKAENHKILALANNQLGLIAMDESRYNESFKKFVTALDIAEKNGLKKNKCLVLNNLGLLFEMEKDTLKALSYYEQNEKVALKNDFKDILLMTYNNMATLKKKSNKKLAVVYLNKAYSLAAELKNDYEAFNILINLSAVYLSIGGPKNIKHAYLLLQQAEQLALKMKSDDNLFFVYFNLGGYYSTLKNYNNAIASYNKALALTKKGVNEDQNVNLYEAISSTHKEAGNFKEAFYFQEKYNHVKDSIFSLEKNKTFNEIQTKYEVEKKNLKIKLLVKEKQIQENTKKLYLYCGIVLLMLILSLVLFYRNQIKSQNIIRENETKLYQQEKQRQQQEQELKRILGIAEGQENERNRIAKEIHDGIGGKLAGLKLHLEQVNIAVKSNVIQQIVKQLANVFQELRTISHNLSNNYIKDTKLSVLVCDLVEDYHVRNEFQVEVTIFPENALDDLAFEIKHQLYRILQELLNNISKHAAAKNVSISFTKHEDFLNIIIEDDGQGFSKKENTGIGLKNIHERLQLIQGTMAIETMENDGTSIIINIQNQAND